jgi:N-acetylmuramic acid 6-phosphate etherase
MNTEARADRYRGIDIWSDADILASLCESQMDAAACLRPALPALERAALAVAARLRRGGRLVYAGAGASGRLAVQDGCELWPTFGFPVERTIFLLAGGTAALTRSIEGAEDDGDGARAEAEALALGGEDVVLGIAASGRTAYTRAVVTTARAAGALTVGIACNADAPLLSEAAHAILLDTGAEPIAGSTRMKAGTAQKIALNLFSTHVMIRLGHVHDGLMVDVQPTNAKLLDRSRRMVATIAGCDAESAARALAVSDNGVKLAVLVARGDSPAAGRAKLDAAGGILRRALAAD